MTLEIDIYHLNVKSTSGARIQAHWQSNQTGGGGECRRKVINNALKTTDTKVIVNAGGTTKGDTARKMEAKVRAGGFIYIYGNPLRFKTRQSIRR